MFDIEDKLSNDIKYFKVNMTPAKQLTYYINDRSNQDSFEYEIRFYDYENGRFESENTKTHTLIVYKETEEEFYYKKIFGFKYYTKLKTIYPIAGEITDVNGQSIDIRVFGEIGLTKLKSFIKNWANDNEIHVNYNVELAIDNYVVKELSYKYFWQKQYKQLK